MSASFQFQPIDVPFELRHQCWFCAEPCANELYYSASPHTPHPSLIIPACKECMQLAKKQPLTSIWDCQVAVKDELMRIYRKHLAIGVNWTEAEIAQAEFDPNCKIFGGFGKSAWAMYLIAKNRVNYPGWPLSVSGIALDNHDYSVSFAFDGVTYTSLSQAINHYSQSLGLDKRFLQDIVSKIGRERFGYAVRVARINIVSTSKVKQQVLRDIIAEQQN